MNKLTKSITVFLSYCHQNKSLAERIEGYLRRMGISVIRDAHELKYTDSISSFMQQIRQADYALLLISDPYLRSRNCLYEVGQLLKEQNVWQKILPVIIDGAKIYDVTNRLAYVAHWQKQQSQLKTTLQTLDVTNTLSSYGELKLLGEFAGFMDEFLSRITDMLHVGYQSLIEQNYKPLFEKLGFSDVTYLVELLVLSKITDPELKAIALEDYQRQFSYNTYYYGIKGNLERQLGHFRQAAYCFEQSLIMDPNNVETLNNYGFLLYEVFGNLKKAQELYEKALSIQPDMVVTLLNSGVLYSQVGKEELAKTQYERVLELDPTNERAHNNLANHYKNPQTLNVEKAEYHYKQALKKDPEFVDALIGYANFLKATLKKIDEGNKLYRKARKADRTGRYRTLINSMLKTHKG